MSTNIKDKPLSELITTLDPNSTINHKILLYKSLKMDSYSPTLVAQDVCEFINSKWRKQDFSNLKKRLKLHAKTLKEIARNLQQLQKSGIDFNSGISFIEHKEVLDKFQND